MTETDTDYFTRRERQQRALAERATDPALVAIHLELADRYADQVGSAGATAPVAARG